MWVDLIQGPCIFAGSTSGTMKRLTFLPAICHCPPRHRYQLLVLPSLKCESQDVQDGPAFSLMHNEARRCRPAASGSPPGRRYRAGGVGPAVAGRRRLLACGGDGPAAASRRRRAWPVGGGPTEAGPATEARADQSQVRRQRCGGRPAEAGLRPLPARLRRPAGPPAYLRAGGVGPGPGLAASGRAGGGGSLHFCATRRRCAGSPLSCMQRSAVHAARAGGEAVADAELCGTAEPASHARLHAALRWAGGGEAPPPSAGRVAARHWPAAPVGPTAR
jgi:hypothetical protein